MKLRVGISMVGLAAERTTGLERFGIEFIRAMRQHCSDRFDIIPIVHEWAARQIGDDCIVVPRRLSRPLALELWLPAIIKRSQLDWLHGVCYGFPGIIRQAHSLTIHDLIPWESPSTTSKGTQLYFKPLMSRDIKSRNLKAIVATTQISREKIIERFNPKSRVEVIPIGLASEWYIPPRTAANLESDVGSSDSLRILSVGTLEPRKGVDTISSAATLMLEEDFNFEWRVVGRSGWGDIDLSKTLTALGRIDDEELKRQYQWADVIVSASRDEGFNLPAAEGLAAGASLVLSDIPVHRELYGKVAEIFTKDDSAKLVAALRQVKQRNTIVPSLDNQTARDHVFERLSWPSIANSYSDLWVEMAGRKTS